MFYAWIWIFFKRYRSGELVSRCTNDINALQSIVSNIIPDFFRELLTAIGLLAVVLYQSPTLAFFCFSDFAFSYFSFGMVC